MATSPDHPELQFVQAKKYGKGRPDGPPLWIVVHDMEASETSTRAENTAQYFATLPDDRSVSSHYCVDSDSVVQCVKLADVAYTVGNRPGNNRGINWEFSGFASQTREQWLDPFGVAMFAQAAPYIVADAKKYGIPLERRTVSELKAFKPGVTSHNDLRLAFGGTTHTDPGPNFPWDYFMALLTSGTSEEDDMNMFTARTPDGTIWLCWPVLWDIVAWGMPGPTTANAYNKLGLKSVGDISSLNDIGATPAGEFRDGYWAQMEQTVAAAVGDGVTVEVAPAPFSITMSGAATPSVTP